MRSSVNLKTVFRLIPARAYPAALNMAIDETLLDLAAKDPAFPPTLRFYLWERPVITAGYFQDVSALTRLLSCREKSIEVIRRLTGGGMVLHKNDLTFSLVLRLPSPFVYGDVKDSYLKINQALMTGLKENYEGLDFADCRTVPSGRAGKDTRICFEKPSCYDLLWRGKKVVGASQRRRNGALLHQSTVFMEGRSLELEKNISKGFETLWGIEFEHADLTTEEIERARRIEEKRYHLPEWAFRIV